MNQRSTHTEKYNINYNKVTVIKEHENTQILNAQQHKQHMKELEEQSRTSSIVNENQRQSKPITTTTKNMTVNNNMTEKGHTSNKHERT